MNSKGALNIDCIIVITTITQTRTPAIGSNKCRIAAPAFMPKDRSFSFAFLLNELNPSTSLKNLPPTLPSLVLELVIFPITFFFLPSTFLVILLIFEFSDLLTFFLKPSIALSLALRIFSSDTFLLAFSLAFSSSLFFASSALFFQPPLTPFIAAFSF